MRVLLAGLWSRRGLNAAALLVTVIALTGAVLGPMYGRASGEHLVDSRMLAEPHYATGLSIALPATDDAAMGGLESYEPVPPDDLVDEASAVMAVDGVERFWGPERRWLRDTGHGLRYRERLFMVPLYWREGMCDLARVNGRCPAAAGEVLVQETMAETMGLTEGDTLDLGFEKLALVTKRAPGGHETVEEAQEATTTFTVVGTYRIDDPTSPAWYDESRFVGFERLDPSMPTGPQAAAEFPTPALLVDRASMTTQTFVGGVDRVVDVSAIDLATMDASERTLDAFVDRALDSRADNPAADLELTNIFDEVRAEQTLLSRVMVASLAPLLVLALLVLLALVSAGAAVRRPYVALAKLRGHSRGQVFRFAVGEPFLVVALAIPVALAIAFGSAHLIARSWLTPGIPVVADSRAWTALVVVVVAALGASVVAAMEVIREPLSRALASALALRSSSRVALVARVAVIAVAAAAVLQLLTSGDQSSQLLALLAPLFIALAVAVGGAALLRALSTRWVRRTGARGSTPAYLAARRLARRPDLTNLMIPLLLAVSVITFAGSASAVSDDWRVSRARSETGSAQTFRTEVSPGRLMAVSREVDPQGRYLAAALVQREGDGAARRIFVDSTRLTAVGAWDDSWADVPVAEIADRLRPAEDRLSFSGEELSVSVRDVSLKSSTGAKPLLWVQYVNDDGEQRNIELGRLRNGPDGVTLTAGTPACATECFVEKLFLTGGSFSVLDVDGSLTLGQVLVDDQAVDWGLGGADAWRAARPFPVSLVDAPVLLQPIRGGLRLELFLGHLPPGEGAQPSMVSGFAAITPASTPDVVPAVVTGETPMAGADRAGSGNAIGYDEDVLAGVALNGQAVPMDVTRVQALPRVGRVGLMADLETSLVEFEPPPGAVLLPELWAAEGTPQSVLDAVEDAGVALVPVARLDDRLAELRGDAFSLGLRLFLLVGLATLLLAIFGVFASAVIQSRWRSYEVASLRVVGVSQRSLVRASVLEYVAMLGLAVVLGLASAWLSVRLVLPTISLGPADEFAPTPDYATQWVVLAGVGVALFV
ncbi:MAG: FtsX-like permease family protein, partial [Nocardioides sp.]